MLDLKFISLVVSLTIMVVITIYFISMTIESQSNDKYKVMLFPQYKIKVRKGQKINDNLYDTKKESISLKQKLVNKMETLGLGEKVRKLYYRGGEYHKTIENLIFDEVKFISFGAIFGLLSYLGFGNVIVSVIIALLVIALPVIDLYGNIQDRQNEFRRDFPYFLQTLAFVLENGSNMAVAFTETVNKQADGVLKEVMLDVVSSQRVNGGDFSYAFSTILDKINMDETREFVEIVQNSLEKGIPVAEIFSTQSEQIARFINGKRKRKIKGVSTKILLPILLSIGAIALLFF